MDGCMHRPSGARLNARGEVIVDDESDVFDVEPPCGHVGRDQNRRRTRPEVSQGRLALALVLVTMYGRAADLPRHRAGERIARLLCGAEDKDLRVRVRVWVRGER